MTRDAVTIVGAGLAGALLAVLLRQRGYPVALYERRPDLRRADIPGGRSINLALAERGLHGLRLAGLESAVMDEAVLMRGRMVHDREGDQNLQPYGVREDEVIWSVHRGRLNRTLLDAAEAAGARLRFNARLVSADLDQGLLQFVDEVDQRPFEVRAARIVGADGAGSALRAAMAERQDLGERFAPLGHGYKEIHVEPASDGGWRFEPNALHIWPRGGYMMIALPNADRSFTCTLFLPREANPVVAAGDDTNSPSPACGGGMGRGPVSDKLPANPQAEPNKNTPDDTTPPSPACGGGMGSGPIADSTSPSFEQLVDDASVRALFERDFADLIPHAPDYLAQFRDNPTGLLGTLYLQRWHHGGRAVLLGDAAHAIVPFHGQGMNCAFEDCVALAEALDDAGDSPDWAALFARFQAERKPNADAIAWMALENYVEMRDAVADPRYLLRRALEQLLAKRHPGTFLPRYSMVMFTRLPYAEALARGADQLRILEEATAGHQQLDTIDMENLEQRLLAASTAT
jgi:kynurenine 3-monooxygenase